VRSKNRRVSCVYAENPYILRELRSKAQPREPTLAPLVKGPGCRAAVCGAAMVARQAQPGFWRAGRYKDTLGRGSGQRASSMGKEKGIPDGPARK